MNTRKTTLCIIDMQPLFSTSLQCLDEVIYEVKKAIKRKAPIIVVEYYNAGRTYSKIRKLITNYPYKAYVYKNFNGGGPELIHAATRKKFPLKKVRFVGVNRCYCVYETIQEFTERIRDTQVEIAIKATWCKDPKNGEKLLSQLGKFV